MPNPKFRCSQSTFTQAEFEKYVDLFYPMPPDWGGDSPRPALSVIWQAGRIGAISLIPVLGLYANARFANEVRLPIEKLARLTGTDAGTVRTGARALRDLKLASPNTAKFRGKRLTCWNLAPELSAARKGPRLGTNYFFFSARLIFGGNWAALTGPQRAVYLGVATKARAYHCSPAEISWLRHALPRDTVWDDLELCASAGSRGIRLTSVSLDDLSAITGLALGTVKQAVRQLKHPAIWPDSANEPAKLRHSPLGVYPSSSGNLIYHFRDHARPWPFDDQASGESPTAAPAPAACPAHQPEATGEHRIDPVFVPDDDFPW